MDERVVVIPSYGMVPSISVLGHGIVLPGRHAFSAEYECVFRHTLEPGNPAGRVDYPPRQEPRWCRFCRGSSPVALFRTDAHLMPEGFGNRELFSSQECDTCNGNSGRALEDQLAKFLNPLRAIAPIVSRPGGVKHKLHDEGSYLVNAKDGDPTTVCIIQNDPTVVLGQVDDHTISLRVRKQPHSPHRAIQAIARMGFMALPEALLPEFEHIRSWLRGECEHQPTATIVHVPGPGLRVSQLAVYLRKQPVVGLPPLVVAYNFATVVLFWHAPSQSLRIPMEAPLPTFGLSPFYPFVPSGFKITILRDEVLRESHDEYQIRFTRRVEVTPRPDTGQGGTTRPGDHG